MKKHEFQVNLNFGRKTMSAYGKIGGAFAPNLAALFRKLKKTYNLRAEQIVLTFQPE